MILTKEYGPKQLKLYLQAWAAADNIAICLLLQFTINSYGGSITMKSD